MRADSRRRRHSLRSARRLGFLAAPAALAAGIAAAAGAALVLAGALVALGLLVGVALAAPHRADRAQALLTWQQVHLGLEREWRRALRRRRWRRRLGLGASARAHEAQAEQKTKA